MAHADYDCYAVCDRKLSYAGFDSETKKEICPSCLKKMRAEGMNILDPEELVEWVKSHDQPEIVDKLARVGFKFCYFPNDVDTVIDKKLGFQGEYLGRSIGQVASQG